jgi:serine/threonine protein kinase/tetratricopeptide (TPR) repeat protein
MATRCPKCLFDNPAETVFCAKCGTKIREDVPDSPESGASPLNSNIHSPGLKDQISLTRTLETTPEDLGKGELFAGRFELIEELGSGGMGKVYRAFDKKIGEEVALKLLHPEIALEERTVDRFRNEIKLARRISHRNVCRLHELHEEGKTLFITMEYVSGQDLKGLIRETGALSTGKAISIAKQAAEGLAEAHDLGVVHRDLKPQNIMVDKEGLAKIMDFGIARSLRTVGMTAEGMIIGTPEYMAPEQMEGQEADQRADIYALGAILFEMATGRVPFEGDSPLSVAYKHKNEMPAPPRNLNSQIPEPFNQLILRCLEKDKENRYQTGDELLADLVRIEDGLPISERVVLKARPTIRISREKPRGLKRFRAPAAIAFALVIAAAVIFRTVLYKPAPPPAPKIPNSIAVISFKNLTGDSELDDLIKAVPNMFITKFEASGFSSVATWEHLQDIQKQRSKEPVSAIDPEIGFAICQQGGIAAMVVGQVTKAGNVFALDVKVLDVETKRSLASAASQGDGAESILRSQIDDLTAEITSGLGWSGQKIQSVPPLSDLTTESTEAYINYDKGIDALYKFYYDKAHQYFLKALELDPEFALAYLGVARTYALQRNIKARNAAMEKASAYADHAGHKEKLYIEAWHAFWVEQNNEKRAQVLKEIAEKYPKEKQAHFDLGGAYEYQGLLNEGIKEFQAALDLDPQFAIALNEISGVYIMMGEPNKAIEYAKRYAAACPNDPNPLDSLGVRYFSVGKLDLAIEKFKQALALNPNFSFSLKNIGYAYALKEEYGEALAWANEYAARSDSVGFKAEAYLLKGFYEYWTGAFQKALGDAGRAQVWAEEAQDLNRQFSSLYLNGLVNRAQKNFRVSSDSFYQAYDVLFKLHPGFIAQMNTIHRERMLGLNEIEEGKIDAAQKRLAEAVRLLGDSHNSEAIKTMEDYCLSIFQGELALANGLLDEAINNFRRYPLDVLFRPDVSLICGENSFQPEIRIARALEMKGETDQGIAILERLARFEPRRRGLRLTPPKVYYELGRLYDKNGEKVKARKHYRRFLDLWKDADPGQPGVDDAKARLAALK